MKTFVFFIYLASLLLSVLMAFVHQKTLRSRFLFILVPFLFYVFIQELGIYFYLQNRPSASTGIFYNIYTPVYVLVFSLIYYRIPFNAPSRKLISWLVIIHFLITLITHAFIKSIFVLNGYLSLSAGLVVTCCGIFFLSNYFNLDNHVEEKHWRPVLWITIGVVTFYPVVNIAWAFHSPLMAKSATIGGFKLYQLIPQLMSIFMYSCFTYAFYLCKKKK
jgi:hypothetical protein